MLTVLVAVATALALLPSVASAEDPDPRIGLGGGWLDAEEASWNLELIAHRDRPEGFFNPTALGSLNWANSDLAFRDDLAFVGSFHGFQIYDIADPGEPELVTTVVCPGGQGDVSVVGDLLFMSVEQTRGRLDCGTGGVSGSVNPDRMRGVRVFDISDVEAPEQVATVQTCRGSHTHTVVTDPDDADNLYVYVQGTNAPRPAAELEGCGDLPADSGNPARWRIEVIKVPVAAPEQAAIVSEPRLFRDAETGAVNGLWPGGDHGPGTQTTRVTDHCHDITVYPEIGLAAGACSGNGVLLDISDPVNPVRLDAVIDPNFAYWHSATFNNDGTKVIFTDEWGGGTGARCRPGDPENWGANAIFDIVDGRMELASYYKLPVPQTPQENCVAHNGSIVPVPGRDIMVQAWYQGGVSVFDFTDSANPTEIAFFDRGPLNPAALTTAGYWSSYWYNGHLYGTEIARGFDVHALTASEHLNAVEIAAAEQVQLDEFNAQQQPKVRWPATFTTVRAWHSAAQRRAVLDAHVDANVTRFVDRAEQHAGSTHAQQRASAAANLRAVRDQLGDSDVERGLAEALHDLAASLAR